MLLACVAPSAFYPCHSLLLLGASCRGTVFDGSQMNGLNMRLACCKCASFRSCSLRDAVLAGTDLEVCMCVFVCVCVCVCVCACVRACSCLVCEGLRVDLHRAATSLGVTSTTPTFEEPT